MKNKCKCGKILPSVKNHESPFEFCSPECAAKSTLFYQFSNKSDAIEFMQAVQNEAAIAKDGKKYIVAVKNHA
jgi:hypothetical protein